MSMYSSNNPEIDVEIIDRWTHRNPGMSDDTARRQIQKSVVEIVKISRSEIYKYEWSELDRLGVWSLACDATLPTIPRIRILTSIRISEIIAEAVKNFVIALTTTDKKIFQDMADRIGRAFGWQLRDRYASCEFNVEWSVPDVLSIMDIARVYPEETSPIIAMSNKIFFALDASGADIEQAQRRLLKICVVDKTHNRRMIE